MPLPPKSPDLHPRQSPPNRPVPHRQVRRCSGKAHSRARTAAAAALARSLDRARSLWRLPFVAFGYTARHARYARRASRARARTSSARIARVVTVFRPPSTHACARCDGARLLARSLARARTCGAAEVRSGTPPITPRVMRVARHARARVRHHRASRASSPFSVPPCTTGTRALQRRRRSLAHARLRARGVAVVMAVAVGYAARDARSACRASRIRTCASSPHVARVIAGSIPPARTRARAAAAAALARSLACSHAHAVMACGGGGGGGD